MFGGLLITYVDMLTDLLVAFQLLNTDGQESWAAWTFASLGASLLIQGIAAVLLQNGRWYDVLAGLLGIKPIVETWRVISGSPKPEHQRFPNEMLLSVSRLIEIVFESLPQSILQAYILIHSTTPTTLQLVSLVGSCAATGHVNRTCEHIPPYHLQFCVITCDR